MNNLFRYNLYLYHYLVRVSNTDTIDRVWSVNLLVAPSHSIAIISSISRSLAIITTKSITSIVSMNTLGASVVVAYGMAITISRLAISGPLAISMSNIVSVGVLGRVVSISMVSLGDIDRSSTISMTIAISRLSLPLAIISTIASQALGASVLRTVPTIRMISHGIDTVTISISIPGLSCTQAGKSYDCCNLSCHGYKCTKLRQIAMYPHV